MLGTVVAVVVAVALGHTEVVHVVVAAHIGVVFVLVRFLERDCISFSS